MFEELLEPTPIADSVEMAYFVLRVLRYRRLLSDMSWELIIEKGLAQKPSAAVALGVQHLLTQIEEREGKLLEEIDDVSAEPYVHELTTIARLRSHKSFRYELDRGKTLLEQLRNQMGTATQTTEAVDKIPYMPVIFVGNLDFNTSEDDLMQIFEVYGHVNRVTIVTDRLTGRSRGFGFVEMTSKEEIDKTIAALDGMQLGKRSLILSRRQLGTRKNR